MNYFEDLQGTKSDKICRAIKKITDLFWGNSKFTCNCHFGRS